MILFLERVLGAKSEAAPPVLAPPCRPALVCLACEPRGPRCRALAGLVADSYNGYMANGITQQDRLRRKSYALWAGWIVEELRVDADRLEGDGPVPDLVFARIDGCVDAMDGHGGQLGGRRRLRAAARFMLHLDAAISQEARPHAPGNGSNFDPAKSAAKNFAPEFPEVAALLVHEDWKVAIAAFKKIGRRGRAAPLERLASVLKKGGIDIDGENLKKATLARDTPGRLLGTRRFKGKIWK